MFMTKASQLSRENLSRLAYGFRDLDYMTDTRPHGFGHGTGVRRIHHFVLIMT